MSKPLGHGGRTADHFANWLLHWLKLRAHPRQDSLDIACQSTTTRAQTLPGARSVELSITRL